MSKNIISGFLSVLFGKIGVMILTVAITPLLVRILGSGNYGDYAFLLSIFSVVTIFSRSGISAGIRKYISENNNQTDWEDHVFSFYSRLGITLAVLIGGALIIGAIVLPVEIIFGPNYTWYLFFLSAMLVADQLFYVSRFTLMGLKFERYSESLLVFQKLIFGILGITLAYLGYDVLGVLAGTAISSLTASIIAIWLLRSRIDLLAPIKQLPNSFPKSDLLKFNITNTIFVLLTVSLYNVDILLLRPFVGNQQTGLYKAALVVAEFLWLAPQAVQIIFIQSSSELWSKGDYDEIQSMLGRSTRLNLLFTLLMVIGIGSLAHEFIYLYFGEEFQGAIVPLILLLPGVLGFAIARPIYAISQGKGNLKPLIFATGTSALLNLILNLMLIPKYGIAGAAIATSIGYGSMIVLHSIVALRLGCNPYHDIRIYSVIITASLSAVLIYTLSQLIISNILSLIVVPPLGFIFYFGLALQTKAITPEEVIPMVKRIPSPFGRWVATAIQSVS
mgnify:CR=1 FL=1